MLSRTNNDSDTYEMVLQSFDSDGFTLGTQVGLNKSSATFASWNWLAGGTSGSSNGDGSTSSTVSSNTTSGFSIVKWSGTGSTTIVVMDWVQFQLVLLQNQQAQVDGVCIIRV